MTGPDPAVRKAPGSLRDPAGSVVIHDGAVYRLVKLSYAKHYGMLIRGRASRLQVIAVRIQPGAAPAWNDAGWDETAGERIERALT